MKALLWTFALSAALCILGTATGSRGITLAGLGCYVALSVGTVLFAIRRTRRPE